MELGKSPSLEEEKYRDYYSNIPKKIEDYYLNKYKIIIPRKIIWRVCLDAAVGTRWDKIILRPAIKNANVEQLRKTCYTFKDLFDPNKFLNLMYNSNSYRTSNVIDHKFLANFRNKTKENEY